MQLSFLTSALLVLASGIAFGQDTIPGSYVFHPNQEIRVPQLPSLKARSEDSSAVLAASLAVIFQDHTICCGRDSALEDAVLSADPASLKDIETKLQGRHLLSDGRPVIVSASFVPTTSGDAAYRIVSALMADHALLTLWNAHLYVLDGAIFDETLYTDGTRMDVIHKLLFLDTRFSDSRREVTFDRNVDDWSKVQGMLLVSFASQ